MRIDLHTHAKWSKSIDFSYDYFQNMMKEAGKSQLDAIALTEHFNTRRFHEIYDILDQHCNYEGDHYVVEGVKVFPGIEVDVHEKGHILLIGTRENIAAVRSRLDGHTSEGTFIKMDKLMDMSDEHACVSIGAHPFRDLNPLYQTNPEVLKRLDAFDLNGRDLHHYGLNMEGKVTSLAELIGLPVVAGSDTHQPLQFGCVYNQFEQSCDTIDQLREAIRLGTHHYHISQHLHLKVGSAEVEQAQYKKSLISIQ
ncbi:PHP-associated domain-containing protein [Paenibacillus antarcticus]|uniref:Polymerase/histidinol phosphatase N-terminal domain-containing protein n=1 Tax=Paenibacillus antarcticus TaxID=253703 RepID=A0A168Q330_9BACL|nr:PHP-associated domain-containing protein [Paenibacillus antarcticus]OAB47336.1 hypothetical protein PBAT_06440 [Paenibacillus antarcticus]